MTQQETSPRLDQTSVRSQLAKILSSPSFARSSRIGEFLTFVVENTLEDHQEVLKETCIGLSVFKREPSYDPKIDPIVRVEARRLRSKLEEFYDTEGSIDRLVIRIPKGGYRAIIEDRSMNAAPLPRAIPRIGISIAEDMSAEPLKMKASSAHNTDEGKRFRERDLSNILFRIVLPAAAAACLVYCGGLIWLQHRPPAVVATRPVPVTSYLGEEFDPALSTDGHNIAFVWDGDDGNYDVYVKPLPNGDPVRLTTDPAHDLHPAWSPDGRDIAFLRTSPTGSWVMSMPAAGGPERAVGELHSTVNVWKSDATQIVGSVGPAWTPDGRALLVSDGGSIYLWPLGYGNRSRLTTAPEGSNDFYPAMSPDGTRLAIARETSNSTADIYVVALDRPDLPMKRVTQDQTDIRGLAWSPDGTSLVFSSKRQGSYSLWRANLGDGRLELVPTSTQAIEPSLNSRENLLVYTELNQNTNIWRLPVSSAGKGDQVPVRLISSSRRQSSPQYSPDGRQIAFVSDRSGSWELWTSKADGSQSRQLTSFHGPMLGTPHWSPDGRWIAFDARPGDHSAIFLIAGSGGSPYRVAKNNFEERMPNWSPDGHYLYYNSNRAGTVRLWRMKPDGTGNTLISSRPAYDSFLSPDGATVYFRSDGDGIWKVPANGGKETLVPELAHVESSRYLAMTAHALYFVDQEEAPRRIKAYDLQTRRVRTIGQIEQPLVSGTPSLSVSPDERYVLYAEQDASGSDILSIPWASK